MATLTPTTPTTTPPTVIDEDILRTIGDILKTASNASREGNGNDSGRAATSENGPRQHQTDGKLSESEVQTSLLQSLCVAMQRERNGWKEKLHTTLQEIDRQHRAAISVQCSLQDVVDSLGIVSLISPKSDSSNGRQSTDIIAGLHSYIRDLQAAAMRATRDSSLQTKLKNMQVNK